MQLASAQKIQRSRRSTIPHSCCAVPDVGMKEPNSSQLNPHQGDEISTETAPITKPRVSAFTGEARQPIRTVAEQTTATNTAASIRVSTVRPRRAPSWAAPPGFSNQPPCHSRAIPA